MTEEKSTTKKAPAARKAAAPAAATAAVEGKAPAVKKATPTAAEKKTPVKKTVPAPADTENPMPAPTECATTTNPTAPVKPSAEERYRMVQSAAYFMAEKDGFQHGRDAEYWARAELEVAVQLGEAEA